MRPDTQASRIIAIRDSRPPQREFCLGWPNQTVAKVKGSHFIQEDSPDEIGKALSDWLADLPRRC